LLDVQLFYCITRSARDLRVDAVRSEKLWNKLTTWRNNLTWQHLTKYIFLQNIFCKMLSGERRILNSWNAGLKLEERPDSVFKSANIVQINNYEIVVKLFHISHILTWYSEIVHKFTRISKLCSTYELTKQIMEICVKHSAINLKKNSLYSSYCIQKKCWMVNDLVKKESAWWSTYMNEPILMVSWLKNLLVFELTYK
jgi:hypothetical protein